MASIQRIGEGLKITGLTSETVGLIFGPSVPDVMYQIGSFQICINNDRIIIGSTATGKIILEIPFNKITEKYGQNTPEEYIEYMITGGILKVDRSRITDQDDNMLNLDASTGSMLTMNFIHHMVLLGDHYRFTQHITLNNNIEYEILFKTPDETKRGHLLWNTLGSFETELHVFEGSTKTPGTAIIPINSNRNSVKASIMNISHTPGGSGDGVEIYNWSFGSDKKSGGESRGDSPLVLKQDTNYLVRFKSLANGNSISAAFFWCEHSDIN